MKYWTVLSLNGTTDKLKPDLISDHVNEVNILIDTETKSSMACAGLKIVVMG